MPQGDYGDLMLGRLLLRETFKVDEASSSGRSMDIEGQESSPPRTRAEVVARHDNLLALDQSSPMPVTFTDKPERNGYFHLANATAGYTEWRGDVVTSDWKVQLTRGGSETEVDLQSRLTGAVRLNDFSLTGERWHAPPIGHYAYYTGSSNPTVMTRTGADGAMTVYRTLPAGVSPRWGCAPTDYLKGRVRLVSDGIELCGVDQPLAPSGWSLSNGLVNVTTSASASLDVQAYTDGAWRSKAWNVSVAGSGSSIPAWDGATLLRNDPEHVVLRLTRSLSPGRATLDLTLRRGSRFVEGYLQTSGSATLAVYRAGAETGAAGTGYIAAAADDADGNRYVVGSARSFTAHPDGGVQKTAVTALDFFIGAVASQATLNANPTFETDTAGWTATSGTLTRSADQARYGAASGLLTTTAGADPRVEADPVPVTPGDSYRASGWLYAPAALPTGAGVNINWFDGGGGYLSTSANSSVPATGAWVAYDAEFTAPVGAATGVVLFSVGGTPGAGLELYGDDVRFRAVTPSGDTATALRDQYIGALAETTYMVRR